MPMLKGKYASTFEDFEIPGLECGPPDKDLGYFDFAVCVRRHHGYCTAPPSIPEHAMASWVGKSLNIMPTWDMSFRLVDHLCYLWQLAIGHT